MKTQVPYYLAILPLFLLNIWLIFSSINQELLENIKGAISSYFSGCFLCFWKLMLSYLKSFWQIILKKPQKVISTKSGSTTTQIKFLRNGCMEEKNFTSFLRRNMLLKNVFLIESFVELSQTSDFIKKNRSQPKNLKKKIINF